MQQCLGGMKMFHMPAEAADEKDAEGCVELTHNFLQNIKNRGKQYVITIKRKIYW